MVNLRPGQKEVLEYSCGKMGISAVPGSGKTHTLSLLAAKLVADESLSEDQEVLVVTLVNSAVDNFSARVAGFLREMNLMPGVGYRVRTLHGLAYDIVREHPDFAGIDNHFMIADERTSHDILRDCVNGWVRTHPHFLQEYANPEHPPEKIIYKWNDYLLSLASNFIKLAKDHQLTPAILRDALDRLETPGALLEMGYSIYNDYQNALAIRGAVDFEDLIRLAYKVLGNNCDYLKRLQHRWPYILEDEAQDSSMIQEKLLRLICGNNGNWVRVGDPNQAIFETFTTANPQLLTDFICESDVIKVDLKHSGRSTQSIIDLANHLIQWTNEDHPVHELRESLNPPLIHPTPIGDAQPNPVDAPHEIYLHAKPMKALDEIQIIAKSVKKWIDEHPDSTVAVLVPRNTRGAEIAGELNKIGVPIKELLNSSQTTRDTAKTIRDILAFFIQPTSHRHFLDAILSINKVNSDWIDLPKPVVQIVLKHIRLFSVEDILSNPQIVYEKLVLAGIDGVNPDLFITGVKQIARWQHTVLLPIDQMIMTIGMELFFEPADLALSHKLAVILKSAGELYPQWQLSDFCVELDNIVKNRFKLYGFSEDDLGFVPENHKGKAVIATFHKAKGLEWDRVYLLSVNNYDFPSLQDYDQYMSEKWFIRNRLNLEAEALDQLKGVISGDPLSLLKNEGVATLDARLGYCAERLRLLYVGITRARRQLVITWNTGRRDDCLEAVPLQALREWREGLHASL